MNKRRRGAPPEVPIIHRPVMPVAGHRERFRLSLGMLL